MYILGISGFYHDSAAALVKDGEIVAAAQEERFTRIKGDASLPVKSIEFCLKKANLGIDEVDEIIFYENTRKKFHRLAMTYLALAPKGLSSFLDAMPQWLVTRLWTEDNIRRELGFKKPILSCDHHMSHAAAAFFPSPFQKAAVLTLDGVGEWSTMTIGSGVDNSIELLKELRFPHSVGMLYSAFTYYTGFKVNSGEYKVMGLAPYGEPKYVDKIMGELLDLKADGSFRLNLDYFDYCTGRTMTNEAFATLFDGPPRTPESPLTQKEMDLAKSVQVVTEEIVLRLAREAKRVTGETNLCLAGGVALNCVANGRLLRERVFERIWIQPAAGDAGGALGCALYAWYAIQGNRREADDRHDFQKGSYLGPAYSESEVEGYLNAHGIPFTRLGEAELAKAVARLIHEHNVVGVMHGAMEFGPRALGNRSILGDPRSPRMQSIMNLKIKFRESFRPFAPSVLAERVGAYFDLPTRVESPYMLLVADVQEGIRRPMTDAENQLWGIEKLNVPRSTLPAITHVDYSARIQTVSKDTNLFYHEIIAEFGRLSDVGVVINTSFNVRGEPIVCDYKDAYRCFMRTDMDYLVLQNCVLEKSKQPPLVGDTDWRREFTLD